MLEALRERARWYREYAAVCGGDNGWCLALAAHNDRLADELERGIDGTQSAAAP